jgi:diadenosine tetraphosphate (Ap4A) HIT family hydrolase
MKCELCESAGGTPIWSDQRLRVVRVEEPGYAGYCRVIWNAHVREMTDLAEAERAHCMRVVLAVETALRERLHPEKVNLGSLGNMTPHLHWHVIARFRDDPHFPNAVWGAPLRAPVPVEKPPAEFFESLAATLSRITRKS